MKFANLSNFVIDINVGNAENNENVTKLSFKNMMCLRKLYQTTNKDENLDIDYFDLLYLFNEIINLVNNEFAKTVIMEKKIHYPGYLDWIDKYPQLCEVNANLISLEFNRTREKISLFNQIRYCFIYNFIVETEIKLQKLLNLKTLSLTLRKCIRFNGKKLNKFAKKSKFPKTSEFANISEICNLTDNCKVYKTINLKLLITDIYQPTYQNATKLANFATFISNFNLICEGWFDNNPNLPWENMVFAGGAINHALRNDFNLNNIKNTDVDIFIIGKTYELRLIAINKIFEWLKTFDCYFAVMGSVINIYKSGILRKLQIISDKSLETIEQVFELFDLSHIQCAYQKNNDFGIFVLSPLYIYSVYTNNSIKLAMRPLKTKRVFKTLKLGYNIICDKTSLIDIQQIMINRNFAIRQYLKYDSWFILLKEITQNNINHNLSTIQNDNPRAITTKSIIELKENFVVDGNFKIDYCNISFENFNLNEIFIHNPWGIVCNSLKPLTFKIIKMNYFTEIKNKNTVIFENSQFANLLNCKLYKIAEMYFGNIVAIKTKLPITLNKIEFKYSNNLKLINHLGYDTNLSNLILPTTASFSFKINVNNYLNQITLQIYNIVIYQNDI